MTPFTQKGSPSLDFIGVDISTFLRNSDVFDAKLFLHSAPSKLVLNKQALTITFGLLINDNMPFTTMSSFHVYII